MSESTGQKPTAILFDFDGTLIDSATSVLAGLQHALASASIEPRCALDSSIIGPPLRLTLAKLAGSDESVLIDRLAAAFREHYDSDGYRHTEVYEGVQSMLKALNEAGIALYIVTNKRILPTLRILDHLGWRDWFESVYALDALQPPAANKPALVATVLKKHELVLDRTWMVGDSEEDRRSAEMNGLRFFAAQWGYGGAGGAGLSKPAELTLAAGVNRP
jgi:phosphoglycolate phosphatase